MSISYNNVAKRINNRIFTKIARIISNNHVKSSHKRKQKIAYLEGIEEHPEERP